MSVLLENLQSDVLNRNVKISILSCFGDISLAIGPACEPYLDTTMGVLRQAGAVQPNPVCPFFTFSFLRCWLNVALLPA
jgi:importin subunit beta-1